MDMFDPSYCWNIHSWCCYNIAAVGSTRRCRCSNSYQEGKWDFCKTLLKRVSLRVARAPSTLRRTCHQQVCVCVCEFWNIQKKLFRHWRFPLDKRVVAFFRLFAASDGFCRPRTAVTSQAATPKEKSLPRIVQSLLGKNLESPPCKKKLGSNDDMPRPDQVSKMPADKWEALNYPNIAKWSTSLYSPRFQKKFQFVSIASKKPVGKGCFNHSMQTI